MQLSDKVFISVVYMQPSGTTLSPATYMQLLSIASILIAYATPISHTSGRRTAHAVQNSLITINPPTVTSTDNCRELSNLAKIYTHEAKYSSHNDSLIYKLVIFHDIFFRIGVSSEAKMTAFPSMLKDPTLDYYFLNISINDIAMNSDQVHYSIRMSWINGDKTLDETDVIKVGVE